MCDSGRGPRAAGRAWFLAALALAVMLSAPPPVAACDTADLASTFGFWLGEWEVSTIAGERVARAEVELAAGGCAVVQRWTRVDGPASAPAGEGLLFWSPARGRWQAVWIDDTGGSSTVEGSLREGVLVLEGTEIRPDGVSLEIRETVRPLDGDRVELVVEERHGRTKAETFRGLYVRPGARVRTTAVEEPEASDAATRRSDAAGAGAGTDDPADPTEPVVAPTAPTVRAVSARGDAARTEIIEIPSPMLLKLPLGPVEKLRRGYAWGSSETARFVSEDVIVQRVSVSRGKRGGRVVLPVTLSLVGRAFTKAVALEVSLAPSGATEAVVTATGRMAVGRTIPSQITNGTVDETVELVLDEGQLEELVGGAERPELRILVTVE